MTQTMLGGVLVVMLSAFALGKIAQIVVVTRTFRTRLLIGLIITGMYACGGVLFLGSAITPSSLVQALALLALVFAAAAAERGIVMIGIVAAILINFAYLHLPDAVLAVGVAAACVLMVLPSKAKNTEPGAVQNLYPPQFPPAPQQPAIASTPTTAPIMPSSALPSATVTVPGPVSQPKPAPSRTAMLEALDRAIARYWFNFDEDG